MPGTELTSENRIETERECVDPELARPAPAVGAGSEGRDHGARLLAPREARAGRRLEAEAPRHRRRARAGLDARAQGRVERGQTEALDGLREARARRGLVAGVAQRKAAVAVGVDELDGPHRHRVAVLARARHERAQPDVRVAIEVIAEAALAAQRAPAELDEGRTEAQHVAAGERAAPELEQHDPRRQREPAAALPQRGGQHLGIKCLAFRQVRRDAARDQGDRRRDARHADHPVRAHAALGRQRREVEIEVGGLREPPRAPRAGLRPCVHQSAGMVRWTGSTWREARRIDGRQVGRDRRPWSSRVATRPIGSTLPGRHRADRFAPTRFDIAHRWQELA